MIFSFKKFLPTLMQSTRWGQLIEVWQSIWEDIKRDKIQPIFNQYNIDEVSEGDIKNIAIMFGYNLLTLDGYTSDYEFMLKELQTIVPKLQLKTTPESYILNGIPFNLISEAFPILHNVDTDKYLVDESRTRNTSFHGVTTLDREDEGNIGYVFNTFSDVNLTVDVDNQKDFDELTLLKNPPDVILPPAYLDTNDFLMLDGSELLYSLTRNFVFAYRYKFIENENEFMSINTLTVLLNDLYQNKRLTDRCYFEPHLIIDVESDNTVFEKKWTNYLGNKFTNQYNIFLRKKTNFQNITKIRFGNGHYDIIDNTIKDVANFVFEKDWGEDVTSINETRVSRIFRFYIDELQQFPAITECALMDYDGKIITYSQFPKIAWAKNMYSNLKFSLNIVGLISDVPVQTPFALPAGGELILGDKITLITTTPDANIWYTTDESEPGKEYGTSLIYSTPIEITEVGELYLSAIAVKPQYLDSDIFSTYYVVMYGTLSDPTFIIDTTTNPNAIVVAPNSILSLFIPEDEIAKGGIIYYTVNSNEPDDTSLVYSDTITLGIGTNGLKIQAIAIGTSWYSSDIVSRTYQIPYTPSATLTEGWVAFNSLLQLLTNSNNGIIRYTIDGSEVDETSPEYTSSIILSNSAIIKAKTFIEGIASLGMLAEYHIPVKPIVTKQDGWLSYAETVQISTETEDAEIRYTLDDSIPTESSSLYGMPISILESVILQAKAFKSVTGISDLLNVSYQVPLVPISNIQDEAIDIDTPIQLTTETEEGIIYYTTDGSAPNENSIQYVGEFKLYENPEIVLKAITIYTEDETLYYSNILSKIFEVLYIIPFTLISESSFYIGSPITEANRESNGMDETQHLTTLEDYKIAKYVITQREYEKVMGYNPSDNIGNDFPVENITWYDAIMFCNNLSNYENITPYYIITNISMSGDNIVSANITINDVDGLGYRLPTETEWERAARNIDEDNITVETTPFSIGMDGNSITGDIANFNSYFPYDLVESGEYNDPDGQGYVGTTTVKDSYAGNDNNLFNIHGNVFEWCWDWADDYPTENILNYMGATTGINKIKRGGSFKSNGKDTRSAFRGIDVPSIIANDIGFRLAQHVQRVADVTSNYFNGEVEYDYNLVIILSTLTEDAEIWYTLDGSTPVPYDTDNEDNLTGSYLYTEPIPLIDAMNIKAIAFKEEYRKSNLFHNQYTVSDEGFAAMPYANILGGEVFVGTLIILTTNSQNANIYYTMDGTEPDENSILYVTPIEIQAIAEITIKAITIKL